MTEGPVTRVSLLLRLRDSADHEAWSRFVEIYSPLVYEYGRRHGLQDADAAELTQEVLLAVARSAGEFRFDPSRGLFRSWLFTVARTKRINLGMRGARQPRGTGGTEVLQQMTQVPGPASDDSETQEWERAFEQRLLDWAAETVRAEFKESTWLAFWRTVFEHVPPQQVAADLGMSLGAVYTAKSRVMARFREAIQQARFNSEGT
ncbi:MAG TPA: sigma-70 family RNA polymerase sigma factor [Polyangiaceae bacterium]|nr:sigma-70 family RNA polymerase sigma factor [Polyangiaceae bacterium]